MGSCDSNNKRNSYENHSVPTKEKSVYNSHVMNVERKNSTSVNFVPVSSKSIKEEIKKHFNLMNSIGKGTYGLVREAIGFTNNKKFAIKTLEKSHFPEDKIVFLQREIDITRKVDHENIIKCYDVYEDRNYIHFVFDIVEGGDLFEYIISSDEHRLNEQRSAQLFSQMCDALHYLSQMNIVHRDIKLENFLIMQEDLSLKVKMIDFGFAIEIKENDKIKEKLGSLNYMAPEIHLDKDYDYKVDMWAIGVVLYNMLSGKQPFSGETEEIIVNKVINDEINFSYNCWNSISKDVKNLIKLLLSKNPEERPSPFEAKNHPWVSSKIKWANEPTVAYTFNPKSDLISDIITSLNNSTILKNDILIILLTYLEIVEAEDCRGFIKKNNPITDSLSNYMINYETFLQAILSISLSPVLKNKITEILQSKRDQCIKQKLDYQEFFNSFAKLKEILFREKIWNIFKNFDKNNIGLLKLSQVHDILTQNKLTAGNEKIKEILTINNYTDVESINFEIFYVVWKTVENSLNLDNKELSNNNQNK